MADNAQDATETVFEEAARETVNTAQNVVTENSTFVEDLFKKVLNLQAAATGYVPEGKWLAVCMAVLVSAIIIFFMCKLTSRRQRVDKKKARQQRKESTSDGKKKV